MFQIKEKIEEIVSSAEEVTKDYYRLSVVRAADKGSKLGASLIIAVLAFGLFLFALLFACMGLAFWIGRYFESPMLGFFIVSGGLFLILIIILLLSRKVLLPLIRDIIISKIYD